MRYAVVICVLLLLPGQLLAAPSISGVSGTVSSGQSVTITGSGFGVKNPAKPYLWADFNNSIKPTNLGLITEWTEVDSLEWNPNEGVAGTGCAKAANSSGIWTLRIDSSGFAWNDYGQKMYLFRKSKRNFDITSGLNWKVWRLWNDPWGTPDIYIAVNNGNIAVEGAAYDGSGGYLQQGDDSETALNKARGPKGQYFTEEIIIQSNSTISSTDGKFWFYVNGEDVGHIPYFDYAQKLFFLKRSANDTMRINFPVHAVKANVTFPSDYRYWADDVYLDTTWARVMIGNASTFSASTIKEIQIPTSWSDGSVTVTVNSGSFGASDPAYVFVTDSTGSTSPGYAVTFGSGGGGDTTAPTVSITTSDPSSITSDSLSVTGTASDAVWGDGSVCKWRIGAAPDANNGTTISGLTYSGTVDWSFTASGFSIGSNTLYIGCRDAVPNWGSKSMAVNYNLSSQGVSGVSALTVR